MIQKSERIPARMVLLVGSLTGFGPLCIDMYLPTLPRIGDDLHVSESAVQLSITACLIGLALGQVVVGPLSDRFGRRRPLFLGLAAFIGASLLCALSPAIWVLIVLRFVQGLGGSAGVVIAQAIVRDQYSGAMAARFFSVLMLITGAGPILAPQIGAELLHLGSWRVLFLALAGAGFVLLMIAALRLPETLPVGRRYTGSLVRSVATMRDVATDREFLGNALACAFGFGTVFAYIGGAAFVLENVYGLSPQTFSLVFAANGVGLVIGSQINARLVGRLGSARLLTVGLLGLVSGGGAFLIVALGSVGGLPATLLCMFVVVTSLGFVGPNATALALNDFPQAAGTAAALLGLMRFSLGAAVAPLVGLGGSEDVRPLAIVMAACAVVAIGVRLFLRPRAASGIDAEAHDSHGYPAETSPEIAV